MSQPGHRGHAAPPSALAVWVALVTIYLVWGSTYLAIRIAVDTIPPYLMVAARFLVAGLLLYGWSIVHGDVAAHRPTRREWRDSFVVGTFLLCGGMGLVAWGEQTVPSGIAALVVALLPAWVALLGRLFFAERVVPLVTIGIVVGLVGVAVLVGPVGSAGLDPAGLAAIIVSPILWGAGSLYSAHRATLPRAPLLATAMQMIAGGVGAAAVALVLGEYGQFRPDAISAASLLGLAYLIVVGGIIGFGTYVWLLRSAPLPKVATYAYVNPVVAFILGAIILGEPITTRTVVAAAIIIVAVALIVTARSRASRATDPERPPDSTVPVPAPRTSDALAPD